MNLIYCQNTDTWIVLLVIITSYYKITPDRAHNEARSHKTLNGGNKIITRVPDTSLGTVSSKNCVFTFKIPHN